jgi:lipoprotein-releasing system permease protein
MIRPLEIFIGLRYTRSKRRNHFISFISFSSMAGIVLGIMALITVLSVMNGFGKELRDRILGVVSHVTVTGVGDRLDNWQSVKKEIANTKYVIGAAPFVVGQGMLANGQRVGGVVVRGVLPETEPEVSRLAEKMEKGALTDLKAGAFNIIIGHELSWKLALDVGDSVSLVIPQALVTPAGLMPRFRRFKVVGIFKIGMYEYDSGLALIHMDDAAKLFRLQDRVSGLRLKLSNMDLAPYVSANIEDQTKGKYLTQDWTKEHANFFRALRIEKRMMLIILLLIVAVAAFNIVSTLVMVVTDKQSDIAILRTLGMSPASIMSIFIVQGTLIGVIGTILGVASGIALALNVEQAVHFLEQMLGFTFLAADVYYITDLPSDIHWQDVVVIASASLVMTILATLYPAWRASKVQPAQALRYE